MAFTGQMLSYSKLGASTYPLIGATQMESNIICPHCQFTLQAAPEVDNWEEPSIAVGDEVEFASSKTYTSSGLLHFQSGECPGCRRWLFVAECHGCQHRYLNVNDSPTAPHCHQCGGKLTPASFNPRDVKRLRQREIEAQTVFGYVFAGLMILVIFLQLLLGLAIISG